MLGNGVVRIPKRVLGALFIGLALSGTALAQQPLKIGFGMSLTGPLAGNGKAALIAMEIWRDDVNAKGGILGRSEEHTSELQSQSNLVCRLLLEKKNNIV